MRRQLNCVCALLLWFWSSQSFAQENATAHASHFMLDETVYGALIFDLLEYGFDSGPNPVLWDMKAWVGREKNRFYFKSEGEQATTRKEADVEGQALYSRMIARYWDFQIGLRGQGQFANRVQQGRGFLAVAFEGLARHWFELEPELFVSHKGDVSARFKATYDILFTQRLILQGWFESNAAVQRVAEFGVGRGVNDIELGARLRYEFLSEVAPYVGVSWLRLIGDAADIARRGNESVSTVRFVAGLRFWM